VIFHRYFDSQKEAEAFIQGVEFAKDLEVIGIEKIDTDRFEDKPLTRWVVRFED
jgi:hypothetical protein